MNARKTIISFTVLCLVLLTNLPTSYGSNSLANTKPWDCPYIGTLLIPEDIKVSDFKVSSPIPNSLNTYYTYQMTSHVNGTYHTAWMVLFQTNDASLPNLGPLFTTHLSLEQRKMFAESLGNMMITQMNTLSDQQKQENFTLLNCYPLEFTKFSNKSAFSCAYQMMLSSEGISLPLYTKVLFLYDKKLTMLAILTMDCDKAYWNQTLDQMLSRQLTDS